MRAEPTAPPTVAEAKLHRAYVAAELRRGEERGRLLGERGVVVGAGNCALCDRGAYHGRAECALLRPAAANRFELASNDRFERPSRDLRATAGNAVSDLKVSSDPAHAAKLLLEATTPSAVRSWFERTSPEAAARTTELLLRRRGLAALPPLVMLQKFRGVSRLALSRNRLAALPDDLPDTMPCLAHLEVDRNELRTLPDEIGSKLPFLETLDAGGNRLRRVGASFEGLRALRRLILSANALEALPGNLATSCPRLETIDLCRNPDLTALPNDLGLYQPELREVWCRGCGLLELPEGLDAASALETLDVGENFLRFVSDRFGGATLANLKRLNVSENALTRLPAALKHSPTLTHLDASGNRLSDARDGVGCLGNGCVALEELRLARNQLETLPRDVAGGPARLLRALGGGGGGGFIGGVAAGSAGSSVPGGACSRWSGLRVLDVRGNLLRRLPSDLAATLRLASGGFSDAGRGGRAWSVAVDGNPLAPDLARLHAAEGARGFLARLADVHDALGGMPPRPERVIMLEEEDEKKPRSNDDGVPGVPATIASRAPRIRAARASAEAPAAVGRDARAVARRRGTNDAHTARRVLEARLAAPPRDFSSRAANPGPPDETNKNRPAFAPRSTRRPFALRRRRASLGGGCVASRLLDAAVLADVRERSSALDELYRLRRDARKAQAAAKARTRWGAAIFSKLDATAQRHARGAQTRAGLLATIESANAEKRAKDEAEFRWMHDVRVFREALSFRAACETAKACRLATYARGGVVFRRGESGEDAVIVVEGRCQLRKEDDDVSSFPGESTTSDDRWGSIAGEASSRHRGGTRRLVVGSSGRNRPPPRGSATSSPRRRRRRTRRPKRRRRGRREESRPLGRFGTARGRASGSRACSGARPEPRRSSRRAGASSSRSCRGRRSRRRSATTTRTGERRRAGSRRRRRPTLRKNRPTLRKN